MSRNPARFMGLLLLLAGLGLALSAIFNTHVVWDPVKNIVVNANGTVWTFLIGMILALAGAIMAILA